MIFLIQILREEGECKNVRSVAVSSYYVFSEGNATRLTIGGDATEANAILHWHNTGIRRSQSSTAPGTTASSV